MHKRCWFGRELSALSTAVSDHLWCTFAFFRFELLLVSFLTYYLFPAGLLVTLMLIINAASGAHTKLTQFLQEVAGDDAVGGLASWKGLAKAE